MLCITCEQEHSENFCPYCGEKAATPKITFRSMFDAAFASLTQMDKGILFNLKSLTFRPQAFIVEYIQGKRKGVYNPISFLIIAITVYLILDIYFTVPSNSTPVDSTAYSIGYAAGKFEKTYFKYFWGFSIIWLSLSTKLFFGRFNFAEHLAINSFFIGYASFISLIGRVFFDYNMMFNPFIYLSLLYLVYQVFKVKNDSAASFIKSVVCIFLFFMMLAFLLFGIGFLMTKMGW